VSGPQSGNDCEGTAASQIEAEAISWVERADREDWNAQDAAALAEWLSRSTANRISYLRIRDGWKRADRLVALRGTFGLPKENGVPRNRRGRVQIAAAAIAAVSLAGAWWAVSGDPQQASVYTTALGGHKVLTLADGSQIELNTATAIRTRFDARKRTVWIDRGEAFFKVVHDADRPFVVLAGSHRITDIGTKFLVRREPDQLQVTLVEGSAEIDAPNQPGSQHAVLQPGDVAIATATAMSVVKTTPESVDRELSWRRGVLVFDRTTLADAAAELNRYNERKVVVADGEAAQQRIVGTFPANNVDLFGRVAQSVLGLHVKQQGKNIVISQ
jgi:transmembrane sensor